MNRIKFARPRHQKSIGHVFDDIFNKSFSDILGADFTLNAPSTNISEDDNGFTIELAVPGLNKEDFNIKVEKDQLIVSSEKKTEENESDEKRKYTKREFNYSAFRKSFHINEKIDSENIDARYENGVLSLRLNKKEEAKEKAPRNIVIK